MDDLVSKSLQQALYEHFLKNPVQMMGMEDEAHDSRTSVLEHVFNGHPQTADSYEVDFPNKDHSLKNSTIDQVVRDIETNPRSFLTLETDAIMAGSEEYWTWTPMPEVVYDEEVSDAFSGSQDEEYDSRENQSPIKGPSTVKRLEKAAKRSTGGKKVQSLVDDSMAMVVEIESPAVNETLPGSSMDVVVQIETPPQNLSHSNLANQSEAGLSSPVEDSPLTRRHQASFKEGTTNLWNSIKQKVIGSGGPKAKSSLGRVQVNAQESEEESLSDGFVTPLDRSSERERLVDEDRVLETFISPRKSSEPTSVEIPPNTSKDSVYIATDNSKEASTSRELAKSNEAMSIEVEMPERTIATQASADQATSDPKANELSLAKERVRNALEKSQPQSKPPLLFPKSVRVNASGAETAQSTAAETAVSEDSTRKRKLSPEVSAAQGDAVAEMATMDASTMPQQVQYTVEGGRELDEAPLDAPLDAPQPESSRGVEDRTADSTVAPLSNVDEPSQPIKKAKIKVIHQAPPKKILVPVAGASKKMAFARDQQQTGNGVDGVQPPSKFKIQMPDTSKKAPVSSSTTTSVTTATAAPSIPVVDAGNAALTTNAPPLSAPLVAIESTSITATTTATAMTMMPSSTPPGSPPEIYDSDNSDRPDDSANGKACHATPDWAKGPAFYQLLEGQHKKMPSLGGRMARHVNMKELIGRHLPRGDSPFTK